ncbi:MAG: efflux RND transporter periplasmic adaptor subunit [Pirellulaceae bacterium]|nr:efflux RND transporter periplasmic adaptor subunit [Pirellulaceae bacterium]
MQFSYTRSLRWVLAFSALFVVVYIGGFVHGRLTSGWGPLARFFTADATEENHTDHDHSLHDHGLDTPLSARALDRNSHTDKNSDPHAHDEHDHAEHAQIGSNAIAVSETARKNLGLTEEFLKPIELRSFTRTLSVPSIIVDSPGRTRLPVSAPMTGIVTHVHAVPGEAIKPGDLILEMRLTHEDLVTAQKEYLQTLGDRDIELKQIARIEGLANAGAVSNKTLLDRQFSRDKLESLLSSQREALRLHGLSDSQITAIEVERRLLTEIRILAPHPDDHSDEELHLSLQKSPSLSRVQPASESSPFRVASTEESQKVVQAHSADDDSHLLVLQDLHAQKGQTVNAGDPLCVLADYQELMIEGQAFETEANIITKAKLANWPIAALIGENSAATRVENLELVRVDNEIDPATRTLKFYVGLTNDLIEDKPTADGQRHVTWKYRTGQRLQLLLPVEQWTEQIVLPIDAVVREGLESFLFQENGDHFERVSVHEIYRDQTHVVIANDGSIYPGDVVALRGAYQMQMALKNQAGGGIDPHAGHNH